MGELQLIHLSVSRYKETQAFKKRASPAMLRKNVMRSTKAQQGVKPPVQPAKMKPSALTRGMSQMIRSAPSPGRDESEGIFDGILDGAVSTLKTSVTMVKGVATGVVDGITDVVDGITDGLSNLTHLGR
jgi:hypothetical protein